MISVAGIAKRYGAQMLFDDVNLRFDPGKRYGIVGANGAGKSTFLRVLIGQEQPDAGEINVPAKLRVGTLTQDHFAFEDKAIADVALRGKPVLADAFDEKERIINDLSAPPERIAHLEEIIADHDGYVAESRIAEMLEGLGIPTEKHRQPMSSLSGGYKLRVLLAQCLFGDPDVLLLDEPTNHLDIFSIKWLEDYLRQCRGIVGVISHDREFLNNVCTHILDVDYGTVKQYTGNYDAFLVAKEAEEEMRRIEAEKAEKKIGELKQFVDRFKAKATKARQAQSKSKQIERMEKGIVAPVYSSRVYPVVKFSSKRPPGKQVLEVSGLAKAFGEKQVLRDVSFNIYRDDKLAILGPNGVGKSTLLKILVGELAADAGEVNWGHETYPEYFSQDHSEAIPGNTTPYEWLYQFAPGEPIGVIRGTLGNLLFSGDDVHKATSALSGGEAARLIIAKLVLLKGNVLVLDEPTNHLDMEAIESLVKAVQEYDGTVLLVSHNRYVVERIANKVMEITPAGVDLFDGTYYEYLEKTGVDHLSYQVDLRAEKKAAKNQAKKGHYGKDKQKRQQATRNRRAFREEAGELPAQGKRLEEEIEKLEAEAEVINELFFDPSFFSKTDPAEVRKKNARKREIETALEARMSEWAQVTERLEALREKHGVE